MREEKSEVRDQHCIRAIAAWIPPLFHPASDGTMGSSIMNRVPAGRFSSTRIIPSCSVMILLTIANPRPVPRFLVEK